MCLQIAFMNADKLFLKNSYDKKKFLKTKL